MHSPDGPEQRTAFYEDHALIHEEMERIWADAAEHHQEELARAEWERS
jgi:hypothetical protein